MPTENIKATYAWLRKEGFMLEHNFTLDEQTEISQAYSAGSYANAYETTDLDEALDCVEFKPHEREAFVLGFFSSYTLDEIGSDRETFDECYFSNAGRYVVYVAHYCDDRAPEYYDEEMQPDSSEGV